MESDLADMLGWNMSRFIPTSLARLAALLGLASAASAAPETAALLLKPAAGASETALTALLSSNGAREAGRIAGIGVRILHVPAPAAARIEQALGASALVDYVEPDATAQAFATPNDPYFPQQWHLAKMQTPSAWDLTVGASSVIIAVVDTGANAAHPDLAGRLLPGYDFVNNDNDPSDDNGHGTAVAGVAAASANNALGVAGVSWGSPVLPVKVLNASGSGAYSAIAQGVTYAADRGARIINLSLGGTTSSRTLQDAVNYAWGKSAVIIAAAGNNGNSIACYPGACANVVAVSATDASDLRPSWSNYGSYVDLSAPGVSILTLYSSNGYAFWDGTSFSSPAAAGVASLVASAWPRATNARIVDLLLKNADDIGAAGYDVYYGQGRVNAARAVQAAQALASDATAPFAAITSPSDGSKLSGKSASISVTATDNVGVTRIDLQIDGRAFGSVAGSSATFAWNTTKVAAGAHTLQAFATDAAGNVGASAIVTVYK